MTKPERCPNCNTRNWDKIEPEIRLRRSMLSDFDYWGAERKIDLANEVLESLRRIQAAYNPDEAKISFLLNDDPD